MKEFSDMSFKEQDELQERIEELKNEYAEKYGWLEEFGEFWWEDDEMLYAAECYAYDKISKEWEDAE